MAKYIIKNDNLIEYDNTDESFSTFRSRFLVSDEEINESVSIVFANDDTTEYNLPLVTQIESKYYYSLPSRTIKSISINSGEFLPPLESSSLIYLDEVEPAGKIIVKVVDGKFVFNDIEGASVVFVKGYRDYQTFQWIPEPNLEEGPPIVNSPMTLILDQSDPSNLNHPLKLSETEDGTHTTGGTELDHTSVEILGELDGLIELYETSGTPGTANAYTKLKLAWNMDEEREANNSIQLLQSFYYYCANHPNMGGKLNEKYPDYEIPEFRWHTVSVNVGSTPTNYTVLQTRGGFPSVLPSWRGVDKSSWRTVYFYTGSEVSTVDARNDWYHPTEPAITFPEGNGLPFDRNNRLTFPTLNDVGLGNIDSGRIMYDEDSSGLGTHIGYELPSSSDYTFAWQNGLTPFLNGEDMHRMYIHVGDHDATTKIVNSDSAQIIPDWTFLTTNAPLSASFTDDDASFTDDDDDDFEIEFVSQYQQGLGRWGDLRYGAFFRFAHANDKYVWTSGHKETGESYLWDVEEAVSANDISKIKFMGIQVSWGNRRTYDPLLAVENTNIFSNTTHDGGYLWIYDITNYKNYVDQNDLPTVTTEDENNGLTMMCELMSYQTTNYYTSNYDLPELKTTSSARLRYQELEHGLNTEMGTANYIVGNNVYLYNVFYGSWANSDIDWSAQTGSFYHGYFSVAVFDKTIPNDDDGTNASLRWTNQNVLNSSSLEDMGLPLELKHNGINFKPRNCLVMKNISGKDYLYIIARNQAKGLVFRIDNNPGLENALPNSDGATPTNEGAKLGINQITPFELGIQIGNYIYCMVGGTTLDQLPWDEEYLNSITPHFAVIDCTFPESPFVHKAIWTKIGTHFETETNMFETPFSSSAVSPWQLYYCKNEELLIYSGGHKEIFYYDVINPGSPVLRKIQTIERTVEQAKNERLERLTGSGSLLFLMCGGSASWNSPDTHDIEMITLNIAGLGNHLRSQNIVVSTNSENFKEWTAS